MTEKQKKQIAVQKAVMAVMEKNLTKWQSVKALQKKYDRFVRNIKKIDDYSTVLQTSLEPLKLKRKKSGADLLEQLFPVLSVMVVYANDRGDKKLSKLIRYKIPELEKIKLGALINYAIRILKTASNLLEMNVVEGGKRSGQSIADYGLNAGHLEPLQTALNDCIRDQAAFTGTRLSRKKSKAKLKKRIQDNNNLLTKEIDRMMHLFRDSHKTFYRAYIKARIPAQPAVAEPAVAEPEKSAASPATPQAEKVPAPGGKPASGSAAPKKE